MKYLLLTLLLANACEAKQAHTSFAVTCTVLPRPVIVYTVTNGVAFKTITY